MEEHGSLPILSSRQRVFSHVSQRHGPWEEWFVTISLWTIALGVIGIFAWIIGDVFARGIQHLSFDFLVQPPRHAGRSGGISTILVGTLYILGVALGTALPIGLGAAILLAE